MKMRPICLILGVVASAALSAESVSFDDQSGGSLPAGWLAGQTGHGEAKWTIEKDPTAPTPPNVLKQSGVATYPVCLKRETNLQDGFVEVKLKAVAGKEDRAGGVVWRAKDTSNYYIARANALEDNLTIYDVVEGQRTERERADVKVTANVWHTLRVDFKGSHFTVTFDDKKALEWNDTTFTSSGMVGVWTKADSVTLFDDFNYGTK